MFFFVFVFCFFFVVFLGCFLFCCKTPFRNLLWFLRSILFGCGQRHLWAPRGEGWRGCGWKDGKWLRRQVKPQGSFVAPPRSDGMGGGRSDGTRGGNGTRNDRRLWFILSLVVGVGFGAFWVLCAVRLFGARWLFQNSRRFCGSVLPLLAIRLIGVTRQFGVAIRNLDVTCVSFSFDAELHLHYALIRFRWRVVCDARSGAMRDLH